MSTKVMPSVGQWYKNKTGETFEVVAYDSEEGCIEIQFFDGAVTELDLDVWREQSAQSVEQPEDWSGSLDIAREDYGVDLEESHTHEWANPLDEIEQ